MRLQKICSCALLLMAAGLVLASVTACKDAAVDDVLVTGVFLDKNSMRLLIGSTEQLTATVEPADATDLSVSWASNAPEIASVDDAGLVTAHDDGDAVITVITADGEFTASCTVSSMWFFPTNGYVDSYQKISDTEGTFSGTLLDEDHFGCSVTSIGDLNGDGVTDLVVGAYEDDDGGTDRGAVWVLFMNSDGTVSSHQKISDTEGGFTGTVGLMDKFGFSVTLPGDIDSDGIADLVVGAYADDDGDYSGAVWVLFLNSNGTVSSYQKISATAGGFTGTLGDNDNFGYSVASPGDLDGDGVVDLVVGAKRDDDGGYERGAVWVLFLNSNGTVSSHQKISDTAGNFTGLLQDEDYFGCSVTSIGDLNGDGVNDLVVGADFDDDGGTNRGAVWVLFMNSNGTVYSHQKISDTAGGFTALFDALEQFGCSIVSPGDLNNDGIPDLVVGAEEDGDGGLFRGAVWVLFLNSNGTVYSHQKISDTAGNFAGILDNLDFFGSSCASPGDLNGDGVIDLVVGAEEDDDGGNDRGALWVLFLEETG